MARRKPPTRSIPARSSDNDKRRLRSPLPTEKWLLNLAARASFEASAKHKKQPRAFALPPYTGQMEDSTYCDAHAYFAPRDMQRIPDLLKRGIQAGLIGDNEIQSNPSLLWTVDDNGWIYEGRITNPTQAIYHGYPVLSNEAIAKAIILRYTDYVYRARMRSLLPSVQRVQERYT